MYSFAQRPDIKVVDEPFFGVFLNRYPHLYRPSRAEVLSSMPLAEQGVLAQLQQKEKPQSQLFLKNMVNHWPLVNWEKKKEWQHVFLFRDPQAVIESFSKQVEEPQLFDLGYAEQLNAIMELEQAEIPFYLLQSEAILKNPEAELSKLCDFLNIPFSTSMLKWPAQARAEDGPWAKYWYHKVHQSTGFASYSEKKYNLSPPLQALAQEASLHYQKILSYL
tara:strand:+ start:48189 stop:48848 length:660 start_codon:yes stop_codon:yes gene_type:complete